MNAERRALLQAVLDSPADDLPRLVYADWLEEHGEAGRAAEIRRECSDHSISHDGICASYPPPMPRTAEVRAVQRRGFIAELHGPLVALIANGPAIARDNPVERVVVTDVMPQETPNTYPGWAIRIPSPPGTMMSSHGHATRETAIDALGATVLDVIKRRAFHPTLLEAVADKVTAVTGLPPHVQASNGISAVLSRLAFEQATADYLK